VPLWFASLVCELQQQLVEQQRVGHHQAFRCYSSPFAAAQIKFAQNISSAATACEPGSAPAAADVLLFLVAQSGILYPVVVRFENQNYAGVATNNFGLDEVEPAQKK
jgi:hypothetical protein